MSVEFASVVFTGLVATHTYTALKEGREGSNDKVLTLVLSVSPSIAVMDTPSSVPVSIVRESSSSTLYHVMEGLGLATAVQTNMAASGCVTVTVVGLVITGVAGGTTERWNDKYILE